MMQLRTDNTMRLTIRGLQILGIGLAVVAPVRAQTLEEEVARFWSANGDEVGAVAQRIVESGHGFHEIYQALRNVERYSTAVPLGRREVVRENADGTPHRYVVIVPSDYDPARSYPIRVYLHGGVRRPSWEPGGGWWRRYDELARADEIAVFPSAWNESIWWQASQTENLGAILRSLKATYNVDDNRVYLFGVSDGGSGAYFHAFRAATPWAAFVPMIGHPAVLANPRLGTDGEMYSVNLSNRPFYILNGETDRLYPVRLMRPWVQFYENLGVDITFRPVDAGHTVEWWPDEAAGIDEFIQARVRVPHPERLVWETERTDRYNRLHWLIINELGPPGTSPPAVANDPFPHVRPSGRVAAERRGNDVVIEAQGVAELTVLFSPDVFDFSAPATVTVNGHDKWQGVPKEDVELLLEWVAKDRDRSMLYGTSVTVSTR